MRSAREGFSHVRQQAMDNQKSAAVPEVTKIDPMETEEPMNDEQAALKMLEAVLKEEGQKSEDGSQQNLASPLGDSLSTASTQQRREPWEHLEEIIAILKTAYPLLALSMESLVDQLLARLKPTLEEDIFRLLSAILTESQQVRN